MGRRESWYPPPSGGQKWDRESYVPNTALVEELPSRAKVEDWMETLLRADEQLAYLKRRGLSQQTIAEYDIGWDAYRRVYTIPVYDADGALLNVRRYNPSPPDDQPKIKNTSGHGEVRLYPMLALSQLARGASVVLVEGEWDCLLTRQMGYDAFTVTGGVGKWRSHFTPFFQGMHVAIAYDCDDAGMKGASKIAALLGETVASVKIVALPFEQTKKSGKDIGDFWLDRSADADRGRGDFDTLLAAARAPRSARADAEPTPVAFRDALRPERAGETLRVPGVSVRMRDQFSCGVPAEATAVCLSTGAPCARCPRAEVKHHFEKDDQILARLAGQDEEIQMNEVRKALGLPQRCAHLKLDFDKYHSIERMVVYPPGSTTEEMMVYAVSRDDEGDLPPDAVLDITGTPVYLPRSRMQHAFLAWGVEDSKSVRRRRPARSDLVSGFMASRSALGKARLLADANAAHVTGIYGQTLMHVMMDLVWHSVPFFELGGSEYKGCLDAMLIGLTRSGKSHAADHLRSFYGAGAVQPCDIASLVGLTAAVDMLGGVRYLAPGLLPRNDRGLVVMDEFQKLRPEIVAGLSSVRSSGIVDVNKAKHGSLPARVRLLFIANPPPGMAGRTMVEGIQAIFPSQADVARLDFAMGVMPTQDVMKSESQMRRKNLPEPNQEAAQELVNWVWTRDADQIIWPKDVRRKLWHQTQALIARYPYEPLLVNTANLNIKIARIAAALAARTFNSDPTGTLVLVTDSHITDAVSLLRTMYDDPAFGYTELADAETRRREQRAAHARQAVKLLKQSAEGRELAKYLRHHLEVDLYDMTKAFRSCEEMLHQFVRKDLLQPASKQRRYTVAEELVQQIKETKL
jgi:hypothetical protein